MSKGDNTSTDLNQRWEFGDQIGGGGFARVVKAYDEEGKLYAAKFVAKRPEAARELLFANPEAGRNVVPVVDWGEIGDDYVMVMPFAKISLRERIEQETNMGVADVIPILIDVATALSNLDGKVVHRDLKPENVLLLDSAWCIADFGISRYAEASTELGVTRKENLTPQYAAPEQWKSEHATSATDVYAFGVMAFELFEGQPPYAGSPHDLRDLHLHSDVPALKKVDSMLAALVQECLFKAPQARPTAANLLGRLTKAQNQVSTALKNRLASVNHVAIQRQASKQTESLRQQTEQARRVQLFEAASTLWVRISEQFQNIISDYLPTAEISFHDDKHWSVIFDGAKFGFSHPEFQADKQPGMPFDVIATATLSVLLPEHAQHRGWGGRCHSLYFGDVIVENEYAWYETAFMDMPLKPSMGCELEPFAVSDLSDSRLHHALSGVVGAQQIAWEFTRIEVGDCDEFIDRWLGWFVDAVEKKLRRPGQMPEHSVSRNWRRS